MTYRHTPVMLKEVLAIFGPKAGQNYIDCTLGGGGFTFAIAEMIKPGGIVISIDLDNLAINNAKEKIQKLKTNNIILINENFKNLSKIINRYFPKQLDHKFSGIVFDLGLSSAQLQDKARGFSFRSDSPLNMNFSQSTGNSGATVEDMVNNYGLSDLAKIIKQYGEEKFAKSIASNIVSARKKSPIKTTGQLAKIVDEAIPEKIRTKSLHPATRTFQALRIAVNDELDNLKEALPQTLNLLVPGGKIVVISYHSLEDRSVKKFFKQESRDCICPPFYPACRCHHLARLKILTKHVLRPSKEEVLNNPRSRSAKLRAAQTLPYN